MSQWKNIGAVAALSITAALAGTGCLAQNADDEITSEPEVATATAEQQIDKVAADQATEEKTGEANQAWFGGFGFPFFGGFGGCGFPFFGGFGGFGGCGFPFFGGFGGFGGCGFPFFGGCGGCW